MSSEGIETKAKNGIGKAEHTANDAIGAAGDKVKGEARAFEGRTDAAVGAAKEAVGKAADQARAAVSDIGVRASDAYATLKDRAQEVSSTVDPFVRESPYVAVAVGALIGLGLGALFFHGGAKVIYVKPRA